MRDKKRCKICGRSTEEDGVKLHIDHIIPVSRGGTNKSSNLRTLCQDCNLGKSDSLDSEIKKSANTKRERNKSPKTSPAEKSVSAQVRKTTPGTYVYSNFILPKTQKEQPEWERFAAYNREREEEEQRIARERERQREHERLAQEKLRQEKERIRERKRVQEEERLLERERQLAQELQQKEWEREERVRLEQEQREALRRKQKEERRRKQQEYVNEHENLVIGAICIAVALLMIFGLMGLHSLGKIAQANRQIEQARLIEEQNKQKEQERLAAEQRAREELERIEAEKRRQEKLEKQRQAEEYYNDGLTLDTETNYKEAEICFRHAAELGHAKAQVKLGDYYFSGAYFEKDKNEVITWYTRAAEQENASAQFKLGWCYYEGSQITKDETKAIELWKKARAQGHALDRVVIEVLRKVEAKRY